MLPPDSSWDRRPEPASGPRGRPEHPGGGRPGGKRTSSVACGLLRDLAVRARPGAPWPRRSPCWRPASSPPSRARRADRRGDGAYPFILFTIRKRTGGFPLAAVIAGIGAILGAVALFAGLGTRLRRLAEQRRRPQRPVARGGPHVRRPSAARRRAREGFAVESVGYSREVGPIDDHVEMLVERPQNTHNIWLQLFVETGIVGLALLIAVVAVCVTGWLPRRKAVPAHRQAGPRGARPMGDDRGAWRCSPRGRSSPTPRTGRCGCCWRWGRYCWALRHGASVARSALVSVMPLHRPRRILVLHPVLRAGAVRRGEADGRDGGCPGDEASRHRRHPRAGVPERGRLRPPGPRRARRRARLRGQATRQAGAPPQLGRAPGGGRAANGGAAGTPRAVFDRHDVVLADLAEHVHRDDGPRAGTTPASAIRVGRAGHHLGLRGGVEDERRAVGSVDLRAPQAHVVRRPTRGPGARRDARNRRRPDRPAAGGEGQDRSQRRRARGAARPPAARARRGGILPRVTYVGLVGDAQRLGVLLAVAERMPGWWRSRSSGAAQSAPGSRPRRVSAASGTSSSPRMWTPPTLLEDYRAADILFAQVRSTPTLNQTAMPSKLVEYMASGRPVIYAGSGSAASRDRADRLRAGSAPRRSLGDRDRDRGAGRRPAARGRRGRRPAGPTRGPVATSGSSATALLAAIEELELVTERCSRAPRLRLRGPYGSPFNRSSSSSTRSCAGAGTGRRRTVSLRTSADAGWCERLSRWWSGFTCFRALLRVQPPRGSLGREAGGSPRRIAGIVHSHFGTYDVPVVLTARRRPVVWHYRTELEEAVEGARSGSGGSRTS